MPYRARAYNVMIASPSDVPAERNTIRQVLAEWNVIHSEKTEIVLLPLGWESHSSPEMGAHPQDVLNRQLLQRADLLVGVFWTRLGTPTERYPSGSVEEIEEHIDSGKPAMLYFSRQPVMLDNLDRNQWDALVAFKNSIKGRGLLEEYDDLADFRAKFFRQLQMKINEHAYFQGAAGNDVSTEVLPPSPRPSVSLGKEAPVLLQAAAESNGTVMHLDHMGGTSVEAGARNFVEGEDRRTVALWEAAIDELEREELIEDKAGKRQLYFVTNRGYQIADLLKATVE